MRTLLGWLARCVPNQGFDFAPLTALRVVTAVSVGLVAIPAEAGAGAVAAANADDPSGDVEQPLTPSANPPSPSRNTQLRANAVNAIKRCEPVAEGSAHL